MAKILRIEKCSECQYLVKALLAPRSQCFYHKSYGMIIEDSAIIHPDCQLEDVPDVEHIVAKAPNGMNGGQR